MHDQLQEHRVEVIVVGASDPETAAHIAGTFTSPYPILADPDRTVYRAYGFGKTAFVLQRSGTVLVGMDGIVRMAQRGSNPRTSLPKEALLDAVRALSPPSGS